MTDSAKDVARRAYKLGLCVVPPREDGSKMPETIIVDGKASWRQWQAVRPDAEQMKAWYGDGRRSGVGLICGAVSGNLEMFEFDQSDRLQTFIDTMDGLGYAELIDRLRAGYEETTPGGGLHWLYRCEAIAGNTTLARRPGPDGKPITLIQTRGEGGYTVIAPSNGRVHPSGGAYRLERGGVEIIPVITPTEREVLWSVARALDEMPRTEFTADEPQRPTSTQGGKRPGDDFNERGPSWQAILEPHGWRAVYQQGDKIAWRRPGKDHGVSATTNWGGHGLFYCFTSSTEFDPEQGYSKFRTWAILEHAGDWSAAGKALHKEGYGEAGGSEAEPRLLLKGGGAKGTAPAPGTEPENISLDDFRAYMPEHKYIFIPSRELWPSSSVNARIGPVGTGKDVEAAAAWLDRNRPVEQMTWAPGEPTIIEGRLISNGGWIHRDDLSAFNLYRAPTINHGDAGRAGPWVEHIHRVYPADAEHIIDWLAQRVQQPEVKINHALVLGGQQGIGKDSLLEPVKYAIGPWNFQEVSPVQLLGRFNGFVKSVILRVSEARDLGDVNRYGFYEHLKVYTASPPDVLRCDEKNVREYSVLNVCGVVITTNHKTDGIYLPADDRRHYVAWSEATSSDFTGDYWRELYGWYEAGGYGNVAAYLSARDLSDFNPKAPPLKTPAFWAIVDASRAPEDAELADALESLGYPDATTIDEIANRSTSDFATWIRERKNRRVIPHRLEAAGYVPVRNEAAKDGLWKISGRRQAVYGRRELSIRERITAANELAA